MTEQLLRMACSALPNNCSWFEKSFL